MEEAHQLYGYSMLYKHLGVYPESGRFRRFAPFWAKKLHDDTAEFQASLGSVNQQLKKYPELGGATFLDCPRRLVKKMCPENDPRFKKLWKAWRNCERCLLNYGQTLCLSQQVLNLPNQDMFNTDILEKFKPPLCKPVFENNRFVPTGELASFYQGESERTDTCALKATPRKDFLTMQFLKYSRWIECTVLVWFRRRVKRPKRSASGDATDIRLETLVGVMDVISCLVASVLPAVTILILAVVLSMKARIAIIGISGVLFALLVKVMAGNPSRAEIFGATAGFYAVAVVFVSSTREICTCV
ncbi:hypothetical protein IQ07DRAFT_627956 [Pyrenochaeta sp. DS3sAY3a]|nr:hypothetical protein IQ07DRAFT_627956 [Pyrenochaeta sp. DS3sAY3a]